MKYLALLMGLTFSTLTFASSGGGTVILLRGTAKADGGKALALKDAIRPGTTIKTEAKSFVKILFADQTTLNVGPSTELKVEETKASDPSLVNLVGGQIRAKVTKDILKSEGGSGEKLLIKTKTAAMGIRGTDFSVSFNSANQVTALVTFEGNVAMTRASPGQDPMNALAGGNVQSVGPGQYSGAQPSLPQVTLPVKLSPAQVSSLQANETFQGLGEKTAKSAMLASPIPPGVNPVNFSSDTRAGTTGGPPPEGSYDPSTGTYAPKAGGFLDLQTGIYVPPPPGSSYDPNTGVFLPPQAAGQIDPATGMYVPPKGIELDPVRGFVAEKGAGNTAEARNLANALNTSAKPENAGRQISFDSAFGPGLNSRPPPPPGMGEANRRLPPRPEEPVDDPTCPSCILDNIQQNPLNSTVQFQITVQ